MPVWGEGYYTPIGVNPNGMDDAHIHMRCKLFHHKEPETLLWIQGFCNEPTFWDIGANIGSYSLYCLYLRANALIYAFEPLESNYKMLCRNIEESSYLLGKIYPKMMGVSDKTGWVDFKCKTTAPGTSGGQIGEMVEKTEGNIKVTSGDDFAKSHGFPDYVKIDIDGQELRVLNGMKSVLSNTKLKSVLYEDNDKGNETAKLMESYGFKRIANGRVNVIWARE